MKRFKVLAILLIISLLLGGCWDRRELDEIAIIMGVGVDYNPAAKSVMLTMQIIKPDQMKASRGGSEGSGGGTQQASFLLESRGRTVFEAIRRANLQSGHKVNWTHNAVIILGKSAAEHGVGSLLDMFIRDAEPRPTQWVLIAENEAKSILEVSGKIEKATAMSLDNLMKNTGSTSQVVAVDLQSFIEKLISKTTSAVAPIINVSPRNKELLLEGMAVFKKDKIAGKLSYNETRGLLWATGQVKSGVITFGNKDRERITLEIIKASGSFKPELRDGRPRIHLKIKVICNLGEQETEEDMSDPERLKLLAQKGERVVRNEIGNAVKKAQQLRADVFGFGQAFYIKYPKQWKQMKSRWDELFPQVKTDIQVDVAVKLVGKITKSLRSM